jgi:hypothetical protein
MMQAHTAACTALLLAAGIAGAGVHIEIAALSEGADGLDTFGAVIGQPDPLGVWIWADEPGVEVKSVGFDILGAVFGSTVPDDSQYVFDAPGQADPSGLFLLASDPGVLVDQSLIQGVFMSTFPLGAPPIVLPTDPGAALLIYTDLSGTAWAFTGGARPSDVSVFGAFSPIKDISLHGWYQIPAPAAAAPLALAAAFARRRRAPMT